MTINNDISKNKKCNFDFNWKFYKGDLNNADEKNFDDSDWSSINLPHDWSIEGPIDEKNVIHREKEFYLQGCNGYFPYGIGWYRKKFYIPKEDKNKILTMQFDGIYRKAEIFINGKKVYYQIDGYTSFYIDITNYVIFDSENIIAIRVNNDVGSRWYSGSGIYRHVWLITADKLHIKNWGTFITASNIPSSNASVNVLTDIKNENNEDKIFSLETIIFDKSNNTVAKNRNDNLEIKQNKEIIVSQNFEISNPDLWSEDNPVCYKVISTINFQSKAIDQYESYFGIRNIQLDNKKGLLINGNEVKMKGVCLHHDAGPLGAAVPEKVLERRLVKLKEIGCNAIRTSHNQYSPEFYNMCDRLGIYVMHEFCDKWFGNHYPDFENQWKKDFDFQIDLLRNHPCIIFYSVGNENTAVYDNNNPDYKNDWFYKTTNTLADHVRSKDSTRIITQGLNSPDKITNSKNYAHNLTAFCDHLDIIGVNYQAGFYKAFGEICPDKLIIGTENYGYYCETEKTRYPEKKIEYNPWLLVENNKHVIGNYIWPGIDYLGEIDKIDKSIFSTQIIDNCGFMHSYAYLFKSMWQDSPVVRIAVFKEEPEINKLFSMWFKPLVEESWTHPKKKTVNIVTFTNCEKIELFINDKYYGEKFLKDFPNKIIKWNDVPYTPGTIKAVAKNNGNEAASFELTTASSPASISLSSDSNQILSDGFDVAHLEVNIVDNKGILVPDADNMIKFDIKGPGKIIGVGNGNPASTEPFQANYRKAFNGKCIVFIQSIKGKTGEITLEAFSDSKKNLLKSAKIMLNSINL